MGEKVDISEVSELSDDLEDASSEIQSDLKHVIEKIDSLYDLDSFSGKAAKEAKFYFNDLHKHISESFRGLFEELEENLNKHIKNFESDVDSSETAIITKDYLKDIKEDIIDDYEELSDEDENISDTIKKVEDIPGVFTPSFEELNNWHNHSVKYIKELDEDFTTFTDIDDTSDTKDLLNNIKVAMKNAKTNDGSARFTNYEGDPDNTGLTKIKEYNFERWDEQRENINDARDDRDAAIKNMNEDGIELVNKVLEDLENEEITKDQYDNILADLNALYEGEKNRGLSDDLTKYIGDNQFIDHLSGNTVAKFLKDAIDGDPRIVGSNPLSDQVKTGLKGAKWGITSFNIYNGMYDDIFNNDKSIGEATVHNATSIFAFEVGSGLGSGAVALFVTNPGGWFTIGGITVGSATAWGFETAYDNNFLGTQTGLDWVGGKVDIIKNTFSDFADELGQAMRQNPLYNPFYWNQ